MVQLIFYQKPGGEEPVVEFLDSLPPSLRAKAMRDLEFLRTQGEKLRMPYGRYVRDGLFELRIQASGNNARVFYFFFHQGAAILTNGFIKKTQKTPAREIKRALRYKSDWEDRYHDYL